MYELAEINGTRLHYQVVGQGWPLVLIHAGIVHLGMWDGQMEALSRRFKVIRYDVRGWGESADPPGTYSDHQDLQALLTHLGEEQAALVGASWGGKIAMDFALAYPEMVAALVLVGPGLGGYTFTHEGMGETEKAMAEAYERGDKAQAAEWCAQIWFDGLTRTADQADAAARAQAVDMIRHTFELEEGEGERQELEPPAIEQLTHIQTPTLLIIGQHDVPDILAISELLLNQIPDIKKVILAGTAHLPNMEKPAEFNRLMLEFLDRSM